MCKNYPDQSLPAEFYEKFRTKYDLCISDLFILEPFNTEIPFLAKNKIFPELKDVIKYQQIHSDTEVVNVNQAFRLALRLLGIRHKKKKEKSKVEIILINHSSIDNPNLDIDPDFIDILGFYYSKYFDLEGLNERAPLVRLINQRPDLIFTDKIVQLSIALMRDIYMLESTNIAKQVKDIILKCGLNVFIPSGITVQRPKNRALLVFSSRLERLSLLLKTYELVLKQCKSKHHKPSIDKKIYIYEAFREIYKEPIPNDLQFTGEQDKDSKSIILKLISVEFEAPFEGLKKIYYRNRKNEKSLSKSDFSWTSKLIKRNKPHLSKYVNKAIDNYS